MRSLVVYEFRVRFKSTSREVFNVFRIWPSFLVDLIQPEMLFFLFHSEFRFFIFIFIFLFSHFALFILFYVRLFWKTFVSCFCLLNKSWGSFIILEELSLPTQVHPWAHRVRYHPGKTVCAPPSVYSFLISHCSCWFPLTEIILLQLFFSSSSSSFFFFLYPVVPLLRCHTLGRAE